MEDSNLRTLWEQRLADLLECIRDIRASEKRFYQKVQRRA